MPLSILVVEDDDFMASLLQFLLERQQMQVTRVADGRAALERIDGEPAFDAVLLDLMLPRVGGHQVLEHLRQRPGWRDTPVLVLSALDGSADIVQALDGGADDYLCKPFNPDELLARLRRLLRTRDRATARSPADPLPPEPAPVQLPPLALQPPHVNA